MSVFVIKYSALLIYSSCRTEYSFYKIFKFFENNRLYFTLKYYLGHRELHSLVCAVTFYISVIRYFS